LRGVVREVKLVIKKWGFSLFLILVAALLQSTLFFRLSIRYAVPDIALLILVYVSYTNGRHVGQITGFLGGVLLDLISFSPLGLNMFIRTVIGSLTGLLKGMFFLDPVFLPMALCAGATFLKAGFFAALNLLFSGGVPAYNISSTTFWIELVLNTLLAPFLFAFFKLFANLLVMESTKK
jgi:rod shape-determining protein MreD